MEGVSADLLDDHLSLLEPGPASFMVVDGGGGDEAGTGGDFGAQDLGLFTDGTDPHRSESIFQGQTAVPPEADIKADQYSSLIDLTADTLIKEGFEPKVVPPPLSPVSGEEAALEPDQTKENHRPAGLRPVEVLLSRDGLACSLCPRQFSELEAKQSHLEHHHQLVRAFPCGLCQVPLFSAIHLKVHMQMHTKEQVLGARAQDLTCEVCRQSGLKTNDKLLAHVIECHAFQCAMCPRHFGSVGSLSKHGKTWHGTQTSRTKLVPPSPDKPPTYIPVSKVTIPLPGECPFCPAKDRFHSVRAFDQHVQECHPYKCPLCPKMVKLATSIRKHFKTHHPPQKPWFCKDCVSVFLHEDDCALHARHCSGPNGLVPPDRSGGFRIPTLAELQRFEISTPDPDDMVEEVITEIPAVFEEGPCDQDYGDIEDMDHDVDDHADPMFVSHDAQSQPVESEPEDHPCKHCDEDFDSESELLDHISESHPFTCPVCHRPYKVFDTLRKHCKGFHDNMYVSVCRLCVLVFTEPDSKEMHLQRVHNRHSSTGDAAPGGPGVPPPKRTSSTDSGENTFDCPYCDKSYLVADSLRKHCRVNHDSACVTCGYCYLSFTSAEDRRVHLTTPQHLENARNQFGQSVIEPQRSVIEPQISVTSPIVRQTLLTDYVVKREPSPVKTPPKVVPDGGGVSEFYGCFWCDKKYDIGDSLRRHAKKVHNKFVSVCKLCPAVYTDIELRDRHLEEAHNHIRTPFTPTAATVSTIAPVSVVVNANPKPQAPALIKSPPRCQSQIKLDAETQGFACGNCESVFQSKFDLDAHIKEFHPYPCPLCPERRYKQRRNLQKHFKDIHRKLKVSFCLSCDGTFSRESHFTEHLEHCKGQATKSDPIESRSTSPEFHGFDATPAKKLKSEMNTCEEFRTVLAQVQDPTRTADWSVIQEVIHFDD